MSASKSKRRIEIYINGFVFLFSYHSIKMIGIILDFKGGSALQANADMNATLIDR